MNLVETSLRRQRRRKVVWIVLTILGQLLAVESISAAVGDSPELLPEVSETTGFAPAANYNAYLAENLPAGNRETDGEDIGEKSIVDRLDALEKSHEELQKEYSSLSESYGDLKKRMKNVANTGRSESTMRVNGRVQVDMWAFPGDSPGVNVFENHNPAISPQDRFGFRRLRLGVKGDLPGNMLYKMQLEFAKGNDFEFRDVYLGWKDLPLLRTVLLGNQKRPYGLDHLNSSRFTVFLERPFVIESFNEDSRRFGLASYGESEDQAYNWRYGMYNLRNIQDEGSYASDHWQLEFAARLANTFWYDESSGGRGYGHWAVSGAVADPDGNATGIAGREANEARFRTRPEARSTRRWIDTGQISGANNYQLLGLENVWNFGPVQLVGEYQNLWVQRNSNSGVHLHGGYAYLSYFLTGEHIPWDRESGTIDRVQPFENFFLVNTCCDGVRGGWGAWQAAYRYSHADFNDNGVLGGVGNSHTLALNWYWTAYSKMEFNAIYGEIDNRNVLSDPADPSSSLGVFSGAYTIVGARFMVDF